MSARLTDARQACWTAIDRWPALSGKFKRRYRMEDDGPGELIDPNPSQSELPALAIVPAATTPAWVATVTNLTAYALEFRLWTAGWDVRKAETLWEEITRALFQCGDPDHLPTFIRAATGNMPQIGSAAPTRIPLGIDGSGPTVTLWTWPVIVSFRWNPAAQ